MLAFPVLPVMLVMSPTVSVVVSAGGSVLQVPGVKVTLFRLAWQLTPVTPSLRTICVAATPFPEADETG
jgi:hypothetical protein